MFLLVFASCVAFASALLSTGTVVTTDGFSYKLVIDTDSSTVTLTTTGPTANYWAIAYGQSTMSGAYSTIFNDGNDIDPRVLGTYTSGTASSDTWTTTTDTTSGDNRTLVVTRTVTGTDYSFPTAAGSLTILYAAGSSTTLAQHTSYTSTTVTLTDLNATATTTSEAMTTTSFATTSFAMADADLTGTASDTDLSVEVSLYQSTSVSSVILSLTGPIGGWFGVGWGTTMESAYSIIVNQDGTAAEEYVLDSSTSTSPGGVSITSTNWGVVSTSSNSTHFTAVVTRDSSSTVDGVTTAFATSASETDLIFAIGTSTTYAYHGATNRAVGSMTVTATSSDSDDSAICQSVFVSFVAIFVSLLWN